MSDDLPTLGAVKPVAICGVCGNKLYLNSRCKSAAFMPDDCPTLGAQWARIKEGYAMQNTRSA